MPALVRPIAIVAAFSVAALGAFLFMGPPQQLEAQEAQNKGRSVEEPKTRQDFARAMARVKAGMPEKDVLDLLGKPDDVKTHTDPGGISTTRTREIWRYGTNGHLTFPTLGCVYIDKEGKAQYVYGGRGEPPDPKLLPETELRSLLRLIDKAPSYNAGYEYDPLRVIQVVNALQPLGKDKALAVIGEYLRVASGFHNTGREGMFLVLRVLFDVPADPGHMPPMYVGASSPASPKDARRLPRFPILLQDDVPLLLVSGYLLAGLAEPPERHLKFFRDKGQLRSKPLTPTNTPLRLLNAWERNAGWLYEQADPERGKLLIANQLLKMIDSVYRLDSDREDGLFWPDDDVSGEWKAIEAKVARLDIRWDPEKARYTFKGGSHLPDQVQQLYRRHIWALEGLNGEAELILERRNKKYVGVTLHWSGKLKRPMPPFTLTLWAVKDPAKVLAELKPTSISGFAGEEASSWQSFRVELPEGTEVRARLLVGKREQVSPVYSP